MRILFDQGIPLPLRQHLLKHTVVTAFELGWSDLKNGELLAAAEGSFDLFITTDQQIRHQQNLGGKKLAILVLLTTSWPRIRTWIPQIQDAVEKTKPGGYLEIALSN
jgi:predicted nuclease of predicted toxin-antitoxin system